jgi:hypothetical protein
MNDTSPEAAQVQLEILRRMSPTRRLQLALGWSASLRGMIRANLKKQFPEDTEAQHKRRFAGRWLGEKLAEKVYGPLEANG